MEKIKIDRISKEAFEVNQRIVGALKDALAEYKSEALTARFATVLKKHLPEDEFQVWMSKDKLFEAYRLNISHKDSYAMPNKNLKDYYAIRLEDQISYGNKYSGEPVDWRANLEYIINRFDEIDCYEWEQNREAYLDQFAALEQKALAVVAEAKALLNSIPKPEHDVLNRWSFKHDYDLERAFPNAFGRGGAK